MGIHKYKYNWDFFNTDSEELYYFLGFVAADGYVSDGEIEIRLNKKDLSIIKKFKDLIVPEKPIYERQDTNSFLLKISGQKQMGKFKSFFNMLSNKKHQEIEFPSDIPDNYIKDFIRGVIDGDGCIDTTKGYRKDKIYIGPRLRILGNQKFLTGLNEATKKHYNHKTNAILKKGKENVFYVTYNFKTAKALLKWIYEDATIFLERKREKALSLLK